MSTEVYPPVADAANNKPADGPSASAELPGLPPLPLPAAAASTAEGTTADVNENTLTGELQPRRVASLARVSNLEEACQKLPNRQLSIWPR